MFKNIKEVEQAVVKILEGIQEGKVNRTDFNDIIPDNIEFYDAAEYADKHNYFTDIRCSNTYRLRVFEPENNLNVYPRVSPEGLAFLETHKE